MTDAAKREHLRWPDPSPSVFTDEGASTLIPPRPAGDAGTEHLNLAALDLMAATDDAKGLNIANVAGWAADTIRSLTARLATAARQAREEGVREAVQALRAYAERAEGLKMDARVVTQARWMAEQLESGELVRAGRREGGA